MLVALRSLSSGPLSLDPLWGCETVSDFADGAGLASCLVLFAGVKGGERVRATVPLAAYPLRGRTCSTSPVLSARGEHRVIPTPFCVAKTDTLLLIAMDLPDETVDISHETLRAGSSARPPRACQRLTKHAVELAHMPRLPGSVGLEWTRCRGQSWAIVTS